MQVYIRFKMIKQVTTIMAGNDGEIGKFLDIDMPPFAAMF